VADAEKARGFAHFRFPHSCEFVDGTEIGGGAALASRGADQLNRNTRGRILRDRAGGKKRFVIGMSRYEEQTGHDPVSQAGDGRIVRRRTAASIGRRLAKDLAGGVLDMKRIVPIFLLGAMLSLPAGFAQSRRYYDRDRRDYHAWNEAESRAYRHWLMEERRERRYRELRRLNAEQQRAYWRWRHEHADWR
jgi:hypothetical protein